MFWHVALFDPQSAFSENKITKTFWAERNTKKNNPRPSTGKMDTCVPVYFLSAFRSGNRRQLKVLDLSWLTIVNISRFYQHLSSRNPGQGTAGPNFILHVAPITAMITEPSGSRSNLINNWDIGRNVCWRSVSRKNRNSFFCHHPWRFQFTRRLSADSLISDRCHVRNPTDLESRENFEPWRTPILPLKFRFHWGKYFLARNQKENFSQRI